MELTVHVDIDGEWSPNHCHHLAVVPQKWQTGKTRGAHLEWVISDVPDWVVEADDGEPWYARHRRIEFRTLVRDLIAGSAPGYDRHAPLNLRDTGKPWNHLATERDHSLLSIIASVDGAVLGRGRPVTEQVKAVLSEHEYEPGSRHSRAKCWRHDHVSGGQGKGTCVTVMSDGSGVFCYGDHSESDRADGYAYISAASLAAKLSGQLPTAEIEPLQAARRWAAVTPVAAEAEAGLEAVCPPGTPVVQLTAALRLGAMLADPVPRPIPVASPQTAQIVWDADQKTAAQILTGASNSLDDSIDVSTRTGDCAAQYPALKYWDTKDDGAWVIDKQATAGLLDDDAARVPRSGIRIVRLAPVPSAFEGDWYSVNGVPARRLLPPGSQPADPVDYLSDLLDRIPLPEGMSDDDAEALRISWLLPALTESCPGALPLVLFTGGSGAGKGVTVSGICSAWRYHLRGSMALDSANEVDNKLVAGRSGAIWTLDELSESGGSALPGRVLNKLKSVMTSAEHDVRIFHKQKIERFKMAHAWFSTGRTMAGFQTDWRRRSVIIQFPAEECKPEYPQSLEQFSENFEPVTTAHALVALLRESSYADRLQWSRDWPSAMPGWQWLVGVMKQRLGRGPDYDQFANRLPVDQSAIEAFTEWWISSDANDHREQGKQYSFRPVLACLAASGNKFSGPADLASRLIEQTGNRKVFEVPETQLSKAGTITIYDTGQYRWRFKEAVVE